MNLSAEKLKEFRLRHNNDNKRYREDLKNKIKSVTTNTSSSSAQTKPFDLVGYRKRRSFNHKNYN